VAWWLGYGQGTGGRHDATKAIFHLPFRESWRKKAEVILIETKQVNPEPL
jgi:hypothetical protein